MTKEALEGSLTETDFGDRRVIAKEDRHYIREALAQLRFGVNVAQRVAGAMSGQDLVKQFRHLVAEVAAGAGHQLKPHPLALSSDELDPLFDTT